MSLILSGSDGLSDVDGSASTPAIRGTDANTGIFFPAADTIAFTEGGAEAMRIDSSGNVGIGTTSPDNNANYKTLTITGATTTTGGVIGFKSSDGSAYAQIFNDSSGFALKNNSNTPALFYTNGTERARITSGGDLLVGKTSSAIETNAGAVLANSGYGAFTVSGATCIYANRLASDGDLVRFLQADTQEGSISVSGATVSYNAFAGSHWSQLSDGSKPEILRGTVMESIDELCEWPDEPTSERLCRSKISDTAGSKKVYGVFMCWDEDWTATNDMLVTSVGAFICRVNGSVTVQQGDLLESNGDGTARVQADDIIRSSTIGKVTCTTKTHEYPDGSYCVPTVLYCG